MSLDVEYNRYVWSLQASDSLTKGTRGKQRYEAENIIERFLISMYNLTSSDDPSLEKVPYPPIFKAYQKREFSAKTIEDFTQVWNQTIESLISKEIVANSDQGQALLSNIISSSLNWKMIPLPEREPGVRKRALEGQFWIVEYGVFRFPVLPERLQLFRQMGTQDQIIRMLLRYGSLMSRGQQWGIPWPVTDYLKTLGFRNEGFASPLNSRFIGDGHYCSLFPDTDKPFGSLSSFFTTTLANHEGGWTVNPPYVVEIMEATIPQMENLLTSRPEQRIFLLLPNWTDLRVYIWAQNHPQLVTHEIMLSGTYYYQDYNQEKIRVHADATYFILGQPLSKEKLTTIRNLWNFGR